MLNSKGLKFRLILHIEHQIVYFLLFNVLFEGRTAYGKKLWLRLNFIRRLHLIYNGIM